MRLTPLMLQKELLMLTEEQRQEFLYEATKIFHFIILGCGCELEKRPKKQCHCLNDE